MAQLLELECPGCSEHLELDTGFAGGVCRCSICGTLMTVPANPSTQRAERLVRPDSPGGRPDAPMPAPPQPATASAEPAQPLPSEAPVEYAESIPEHSPAEQTPARTPAPVAAPEPVADEPGVETYVTESGQVVQIDWDTVPTASKKRVVVRMTTAVLFFCIVGGFLALMITAMVFLTVGPPPVDESYLELQNFEYNRDVNPFTMDAPNVLGMPLGSKAVIVVDAAQASDRWLQDIKRAVAVGLTRANSRAQVTVIYATAGDIETLGGLRDIGGLSKSQLIRFQEPFEAAGSPQLRAAIEEGVEASPESVILITSRRASEADAEGFEGTLEGNQQRLDVINVGTDDPAFQTLAEQTGGRYVFISGRTLDNWKSQAQP